MRVNKRFLIYYVNRKLNKKIPIYHIAAIVGFLFDEILVELANNSTIVIGKFGKFVLKKLGSRRHYDVVNRKLKVSEGNKNLRFFLHKDIRELIINNLDKDKTIGDD